MMAKLVALIGIAFALASPPLLAAPVGYEGDLASGESVTGSVSGSGWFLNDETQVDFWQFSGTANQVVSISGTPLDTALDLAFSVYRGASSELSAFLNNSDWTPEGPDFLDFAFGSTVGEVRTLVGLTLPATDVYTIAIGGFFSEGEGPFGYRLSLAAGSTPNPVPLPSTALLLAVSSIVMVAVRRRQK